MSLENMPDNVRDELAKLANDLSNDPDTRTAFLRLAQKKRPDVPMPEVRMEEAVQTAVAAERAEREKLEAKLRERDAREELDKRRQKLITSGKARDEKDVEAIEKIMLERGITNHEAAADYFNWMNQAAAPSNATMPASTAVFDKGTRERIKPFFANAANAAREEGFKAIADLRAGRVKLQ